MWYNLNMINQAEFTKIVQENQYLNQENKALKEHCSELETQVKWLMEQLKINNKKTYGSKSEQSEYI